MGRWGDGTNMRDSFLRRTKDDGVRNDDELLCHRGRRATKGGVPNGSAMRRTRGCWYGIEGVREARAAAMMVTTITIVGEVGGGKGRARGGDR
ncbi:hypothetical protein K0M31_001957 [Melipona bicolor]|uniref:Uncharacterized protein n=1 Tax=Melipona bicolor TaxID=60889 RepID=A0AA40KYQ1_9HYME|nr:hypothetical protein K0M31_001957 [Melipona bicolor]